MLTLSRNQVLPTQNIIITFTNTNIDIFSPSFAGTYSAGNGEYGGAVTSPTSLSAEGVSFPMAVGVWTILESNGTDVSDIKTFTVTEFALLDYALSTLAQAKLFLGITDTDNDNLIITLINSATDWLEKQFGGRRMKLTSYVELYDGNGSPDLFLRNFEVKTITSIELRTSNSPETFEVVDAGNYVVDKKIGRVNLGSSIFEKGVQNYRVTYEAGFDFATDGIPSDLQLLCDMVISKTFNLRKSEGISSESLGAYSVTYIEDAVKGDEEIRSMIASYKKYFF